jgi:autotransporter strand-loop-strand O-heptosyltransferase
MDNIIQTKIIIKPEITQFFIDNPFIEIKGEESDKKYKIEFHDESGNCHYSEELKINHWIRLNRRYYTKWNTKIWENDTLIYDYTLDLKNKRVLISIESRSLGDTLAWIPYIREFKDKHQCDLVVSTFMNNLFRETYPDIEFVEPGTNVNSLYALYRVGWYYTEDGKFDESRNPNDFKKMPLQKCAADILGLEYREVRPLLKSNEKKIRRKVGIGIHSTAQAKYWNRHNGWQEIVNFLNGNGFDVYLYSNENSGFMGNYNPDGIIKYKAGSIEKLIDDMSTCEFFIGLGSGLSWLAWALKLPVVLISGFSEEYSETTTDTYRVINNNVCHGCFNSHRLDAGDWNWCPVHKNTQRMFECTREITPEMVIEQIKKLISNNFKQS